MLLVCAGTEGSFSIDDFYAAGLIARILAENGFSLSDLAWSAALLAARNVNEVVNEKTCRHLRTLKEKSFSEDISYCLEVDASHIIPIYNPEEEYIHVTLLRFSLFVQGQKQSYFSADPRLTADFYGT